jgi:serine/threonine protein kinase
MTEPPGSSRSRPREPARLVAGARLSERYRLERIVGSGGMASVWLARDELLGRPVAVKVMSDALAADRSYVARFAREARTAAGISHPNLVQIYDYSASTSQPYLVMEYVDGGTLSQRTARRALTASELRRLARELLSAIARVHSAGVLHRDIKPANVLLGSDGRARLTDFGIARLEDSTRLTQPGQVVGTLRYLAPELIEGAPPSRRSDLYALGVLLREIAPENLEDRQLAEVIERLAAPSPDRRPADADEVLGQLEGAEHPARTAPLPAAAPSRPSFRVHSTRSWRRLALAAGTLALLVAVVVLAAGGGGRARTRASTRHSTAAGSGVASGHEVSRRAPVDSAAALEQRLDRLAAGVRAAAR